MTDSLGISVLAGLAAGIALLVLVSAYAKPSFVMTDDEILEKARSLPEVQALLERYTPLEQIGRDGTTSYVYYQIGRTWPGYYLDDDFTKFLHLTVRIDPFGRSQVWYECLGRMSTEGPATVEFVRTTQCIERP